MYPVQRAPALCGVWGRVSVASLTLACVMRRDRDSNQDLSVTGGKLYRLHQAHPSMDSIITKNKGSLVVHVILTDTSPFQIKVTHHINSHISFP